MRQYKIGFLVAVAMISHSGLHGQQTPAPTTGSASVAYPGEKHLRNIRQLTFGGQNAEAYWAADDKYLIFQHQGEGVPCDQIYTIPVDTPDGKPATPKLVSTGKGRTTCSYFFPAGDRILFSSTHAASAECPPKPDYSKGYVWPIYSTYDIYTAKPDGSELKRLTDSPGYDAEATITSAHLTVGAVMTEHSASVPAGHVIRQRPVAGTSVVGGTAVPLVVSLGPELNQAPVAADDASRARRA